MERSTSTSFLHVGGAQVLPIGRDDDFRASTPGKPFLKALLSTLQALEQQQHQQQQQTRHRVENESGDGSFRRRVQRLSSTRIPTGTTNANAIANVLAADADVAAGEFVLRINAQCLFYLQELFRAMLVPVTSDRGLVTQWRINTLFLDGLEDIEEIDLGPAGPRKILKLGGYMLEQTALIVNGTADEANMGAPGSFDLALFPRLQYLRLDGCNLADVKNMGVLRSRLKGLRFYNHPVVSLSALLGNPEPDSSSPAKKTIAGKFDSNEWSQLESLAVVNSSLTELHSSVALLSVVRVMRLSQNKLSSIEPLTACACLQELDLSHNIISSMVGASQILPQIISLDLSHNALSSTAGLEKLFTLEVLNLSHNAISNIAEVGYLVALPNLHSLFLNGNPIERSLTYRSDVQKLLTSEMMLDGVPWASQDVNDFAKQKELRPNEIRNGTCIHEQQCRVTEKVSSGTNTGQSQSSLQSSNAAIVVLLRSLLLACIAIVLVHGFVRLTWARDVESERLLLILLGFVGVAGGLLFVVASVVSWVLYLLSWQAQSLSVDESVRTGKAPHSEGSFRRMSRRLSVCLVDDTFIHRQKGTSQSTSELGDRKLSLTTLQTSLQSLSESPPQELSLLVFLTVCSELQTMVELLSPAVGDGEREGGGLVFAWNILSRSISTLEAATSDLRNATLQEMLQGGAEDEETGDDTAANDPVKPALRDLLRVFSFMATVLLELTTNKLDEKQNESKVYDTSNALGTIVVSAYRQVFAQLHPWIVQKTVEDTIAASMSPQIAFFAALRRGNERVVRNERMLVEVLRMCGDQLQALHDHLSECLDEELN